MKKLYRLMAGIMVPVAAFLFVVAPVSAQINTQGSVDTTVDATVDTNTDMGANVDGSESDVSTDTNTDVQADADAGFSFTVNRSDVNVKTDGTVSSGADITASEVVNSEAGFQAFVRQMMEADTQVDQVDVSDEEVTIKYKQDGKVLGFIPVKMGTKVTVHANGDVSVDYPWYRFATDVRSDVDIESQIQSRADAVLGTRADASADADTDAQFSTEQKILLVGEMYQVLQAELGADVHTNSSVDVDVDGNATSSVEIQ